MMATSRSRQLREWQARVIILAIHKMTVQVEQAWRQYHAQSLEERVSIGENVLLYIDRLANLFDLAEFGQSVIASSEHRTLLLREIAAVRKRLAEVSTFLAIRRISAMARSIEKYYKEGAHPLGKSVILRQNFLRYAHYLHRFSVVRIPSDDWAVMKETVGYINGLAAVDRTISLLCSFSSTDEVFLDDLDLDHLGIANQEYYSATTVE